VSFERLGGETVWKGRTGELRVDRFRHTDGAVVERDVFVHPGAVVVLPFDGHDIWLVRQPREAVEEASLLELPAGKLDVEGEEPLHTAQRELREEIGKSAGCWKELTSFYASPGFCSETVHAFLAEDLRDDPADQDEHERIEVVHRPIEQLDELIRDCRDAKSLVTLLWFRTFCDERSRGMRGAHGPD
jgi:8-oxo-dGTP pyrophosphatase MutT (NUDIX family)